MGQVQIEHEQRERDREHCIVEGGDAVELKPGTALPSHGGEVSAIWAVFSILSPRREEHVPAKLYEGGVRRCGRCDTQPVDLAVRRAGPDDQPLITAMVRRARLNPAGLHWEHFVVGELDARAVGIAQLRSHSDGTKELASLVVEPGHRGHGIATQMVEALLADVTADVYTLIDSRFASHFSRWGFTPVAPRDLPQLVRRTYLVGRAVTTVGSLLRRDRIRLIPLLRRIG